jgi:hypothetical protein
VHSNPNQKVTPEAERAQDCVLGNSQPSLRDCSLADADPALRAGLISAVPGGTPPMAHPLTAQTQPISLVGETDSQKQHAQEEKTKHAVPLALMADAV